MIRAVFFDVGETLVNETRQWDEWADWLDVPKFCFAAALGAVIQRGGHHREVFTYFDKAFDYEKAKAERKRRGLDYSIRPDDLYEDAVPTLKRLAADGYIVGIAGNQPEETERALAKCGVRAQIIASSMSWGVEKPSVAFFERMISEANVHPSEIVYVGDRLDNDVIPASKAGLHTIFIRRGPWAPIQSQLMDISRADAIIDSLTELHERLATL
ncbi:HAD family hydrolase [Brucella endophytica]|uniref:HAD family hydrolase n=1 Tax=Brucella endophytica TaxID=1963359 RepID=UPI001666E44D|nr:HAD family hydrolase [Brucella endophytica]